MRFGYKVLLINLINVYTLSAQVTGLSGWNIFLDPGHSQRENMGIYGYSEAEKNLRVALNLRDMLLSTTDIDTVYVSRTNDQEVVSLSQRTDYANSVGAAWFHSIHSDAGSPESTSTLLLWGQYENNQEKVPHGGRAMSDIMINILSRGMRTGSRGSVGDHTFYGVCPSSRPCPYLWVNYYSSMPSELSEAGFHTNPTQNQRNMNAEWRRLQAKTYFWSILKFHGIERPFAGTCAGFISDAETGVPLNGAKVSLHGETYTTDTFASLFNQYTNDPELLHNGFYYFENLPDSTLQMIIEAGGYNGDTLQVSFSDSFFTFKDIKLLSNVPPFVQSTTPVSGDTTFPAWDDIVVEFSRRMNRASVEAAFQIAPSASGSFSWQDNDTQMFFHADTLLFETSYLITIAGTAVDVYSHFLDGNGDGVGGDAYSLAFETGPPDVAPPVAVSIYPANASTNAELWPIVSIAYDEQLDSSSLTSDIFKLENLSNSQAVAGSLRHYVVKNRSVLNFFPDEALRLNQGYASKIAAGVRDIFGNQDTSPRSYRFKTVNYALETTKIDDFESNVTTNWWVPQQSGSTGGILTDSTFRDAESGLTNVLTKSTTAFKIHYGWDVNASSWLIRDYLSGGKPRTVLFDKSYILQVYVFGDGSGNQFRFCLDDNFPTEKAANHEVSPWYTVDWIGWRLVSWDMTSTAPGTWLGDGQLDGALRIDSIQLTYNPGSTAIGELIFDDLQVVKKSVTDVERPIVASLPTDYALLQNYPNPFNPETTINYRIPETGTVRIVIYDALGKKVRTLVQESRSVGEYQVRWDGKDDDGKQVASGIYLCRLSAGEFSKSIRMTFIK